MALLLCVDMMAVDNHKELAYENPRLNSLYSKLPDSLTATIREKPLILFMRGHYAHIWSLVLRNDSNFLIYSGRMDEFGENHLYEPIEPNILDTISFLAAYEDVFKWALDSLPTQSQYMKAVYRDGYSSFSSNLSIVNQDSTLFDSSGASAYSGPDSVGNNNKYSTLSYIMYWIAQPLIREYTPDSIFLVHLIPTTSQQPPASTLTTPRL